MVMGRVLQSELNLNSLPKYEPVYQRISAANNPQQGTKMRNPTIKVSFNSEGHQLSGALQLPVGAVRAYAVFAHCFTCGKNISAASNIARALGQLGIAVLRFDFTGLGNSDGDFANTNFSSNLQDLRAAIDFLRKRYQAPSLLIGHSLGGAAVLAIAGEFEAVKAVATIGAPRHAEHVTKNFGVDIDTINAQGKAEVNLAGRNFTIQKQFLDDIKNNGEVELRNLRKAVLICHSPVDEIVGIAEAEKIYHDLLHPKSFISLDKANHLLTDKIDSQYVAEVIAAWATRYIPIAKDKSVDFAQDYQIHVTEKNHQFLEQVASHSHTWFADEPVAKGGQELGPDPYDHLLAALGTCTVMTLRMYANHKRLPLDDVEVLLRHRKDHCQDCENAEDGSAKLDVIERKVNLIGELDEEQRQRLLQIANRCPVHKTLTGHLSIQTSLA